MRVLVVIAFVLALAAGCSTDIAEVEDGAKLYELLCARCHGTAGVPPAAMANGLGVRDLSAAAFQSRVTDPQIYEQIAGGAPDKGMPGFGSSIQPEQIRALVAHVRGLAK